MPTPTPTPAPTVVSVFLNPTTVYNAAGCGATRLIVTAELTNATSAPFTWVAGTTSGSGSLSPQRTVWTGGADLTGAEAGPLTVTVVASGQGGTASRTASATVANCKP